MKKLGFVLVLGLAVSGIGGCGMMALPRPKRGCDGGTKVGEEAGTDADGGARGRGWQCGNSIRVLHTLDAASVPILVPDRWWGGTRDTQVGADGQGRWTVGGVGVCGWRRAGGWFGRWSTLSMHRQWTFRRQSTPRRWKTVAGDGGRRVLAVRVVV